MWLMVFISVFHRIVLNVIGHFELMYPSNVTTEIKNGFIIVEYTDWDEICTFIKALRQAGSDTY